MNKLIKNELVKIFKKKIIYILFAIVALIIIVNTIIGTDIYNGIVIDHTEEAREQELIELNNNITQLEDTKTTEEYIKTKTKLDIAKLIKEYPIESWQEQAIIKNSNEVEQMLREINIYTYQIKDSKKLEEVNITYNEFLQPLRDNNWRDFVNLEIEKLENSIKQLENEKEKIKDKQQKINIENQIKQYKFDMEFLKVRLDQNISYAKSDRNTLLKTYQDSKQVIETYSKSYEELNYKEKVQYNERLANTRELEYKIYHNISTLKADNSRDMLYNSFQFYEILIVLVIIIISGTIVSEEFNKGTIKLLLIKPHRRWKILLSKLLATVIITVMLILFIVIIQSLAGGFIYGFEDYATPIIQYNFNKHNVMELNVFNNIFILVLAKIPMYLLILSITFSIATISCNTSLSIILSILVYLSKNIIYLNENMEFSKYLLTANWDFTRYLYGGLPEVSFLRFDFSVMICLITFIIIIFISFAYFKNKDIKNI